MRLQLLRDRARRWGFRRSRQSRRKFYVCLGTVEWLVQF